MDQQELLEQFIAQRGLTVPDHRPLYAYKCSEREYAIAKSLIRKMLPRVLAGHDFKRFHEVFAYSQPRRGDASIPVEFLLIEPSSPYSV